jgi:hypothetical protein
LGKGTVQCWQAERSNEQQQNNAQRGSHADALRAAVDSDWRASGNRIGCGRHVCRRWARRNPHLAGGGQSRRHTGRHRTWDRASIQ